MIRLLPLLLIPCLVLTGCYESVTVNGDGYSTKRFGADVAAVHYKSTGDGKFAYTQIKANNSKSFKAGAGVVNNAIGAWGLVEGAKEMTAQKASDNALKASQAKEATAQVGLQTAPTVYLPAEGEAVSRAGGAVVIP